MATAKQLDEAVRTYMLSVKNPAALKDEQQLTQLEASLAEEEDPLERVKLQAQLNRAQSVTPEDFEQAFVENAKEWASKNDVPPEAFLAEGVEDDVLVKAGLLAKAQSKPPQARRSATRSRVPAEEVRNAIRSQSESFTTNSIQELTGASAATVRKYIQELLDEKVLVEEGPDSSHQGRGRAPILYAVKGSRQ